MAIGLMRRLFVYRSRLKRGMNTMKDKNNDKGLFKHFYEHPIFFITFES